MNAPYENAPRLFPKPEKDDRSTHAHRQLIGITGMLLPAVLWLMAGWRPMDVNNPWELLGSISAYYYTGAVSAFAGGLIGLALFLFSYLGYDNKYGHRDRVAAIIAGSAAVLVALFPTRVPSDLPEISWWTPPMGWIHYGSAAVLFSSFIFFSLFQFPRSRLDKKKLPTDKRVRNWIYIACGVAIVGCIAWVVIALFFEAPIFWPETLALEFFAVSWLVKGRADKTAVAAGRQALHYGRHPRQLVEKAWSALGGNRSAGPMPPQKEA
jgi:hypothetical protein